jgi:hypothetical protein
MIELCSCLKLEEEHAGLSSDAAFGFYWITVLMQSALSYASNRLVVLNMEKGEKHILRSSHDGLEFEKVGK